MKKKMKIHNTNPIVNYTYKAKKELILHLLY